MKYVHVYYCCLFRLKGTNYPSQFFFVNKISTLPINGATQTFIIDDEFVEDLVTNIDSLSSIVLILNDDYGYCITDITVKISDDVYEFSSNEYFGTGIIISNKCDYSFRYLCDNQPIVQCYDNYLELNRLQPRGIYTLDIHTCISDGSDMTASNMKDNVYAVCV